MGLLCFYGLMNETTAIRIADSLERIATTMEKQTALQLAATQQANQMLSSVEGLMGDLGLGDKD